MPLYDVETLIIGAGVVGLACARAMAKAGQDVIVLEQHPIIGSETSARNSEVIHAGIYYPKGSLKAQTCVRGKHLLYEFCETHNVPHKQIGKLIVATNEHQQATLSEIQKHAADNGVDDLVLLDANKTQKKEPHLNAVASLFSPSTGIVDSHAYMLALQGEAEQFGCQIAFNTKAISYSKLEGGGFELACSDTSNPDEITKLTCKNLIVNAGLHSSLFLNAEQENRAFQFQQIRYAKGNYFRLSGKAPFSHLIYPVPEPGGLGVHLTLDLGGQARFGPDVEWTTELDYEVDPRRGDKFYAAIRDYWPDLANGSLEADYSGIRPKLSAAGEPNADFKILDKADHGIDGLIALLGIESPGLTASLAIAEQVESRF